MAIIGNGLRLLSIAFLLLFAGCRPDGDLIDTDAEDKLSRREEGRESAVARIEGKSGSSLNGDARFTETGGGVRVVVSIEGAPPGPLAVHLHETGDCSAPDASTAGGHWNPEGEPHGRRGSESFHAGDIGNIEVGSDGKGTIQIVAENWKLDDAAGEQDPLGKAVVIHAGRDDFETQPDGAAGTRIGCGVIELASPTDASARNP
ncbi:MAG TPA: superoxide dismutase family protein [Vicinamibacteria bacterium]